MTRLAPIALLALTACTDAVIVGQGINTDALLHVARSDATRPVEFTNRGGQVIAARAIAAQMNMRQQCMRVRRPIASAEVLIARLVTCIEISDPDAPLFGIHAVTVHGVPQMIGTLTLYGDMRSIGCLWYYLERPEARRNALVYVSWNQLERECR